MRGNFPFGGASWRTGDYIFEWFLFRFSPQSSCTPIAEILGHCPLTRLPKKPPRLPAGSRHHRDLAKFFVCSFGAIASAERLNKANNFTALLKTASGKT